MESGRKADRWRQRRRHRANRDVFTACLRSFGLQAIANLDLSTLNWDSAFKIAGFRNLALTTECFASEG